MDNYAGKASNKGGKVMDRDETKRDATELIMLPLKDIRITGKVFSHKEWLKAKRKKKIRRNSKRRNRS